MSLVNRGIIFPLVVLALGATSLGCASSSVPDADDVAVAAADSSSDHEALVSAVGLTAEQQATLAQLHAEHADHHPDGGLHHRRPTIEQIVQWFTNTLDLTPEQQAKLHAYLEAHMPGAGQASAAPAHT
jgi:hypothetical protein